MKKPYFIAEVSSNHSRDLARSKQFIDVSADIGCDAVKFQLFKIDELFAPEVLAKSEMHRKRKNWELPVEFIPELAAHCEKRGLDFICTPFYLDSVKELEPYIQAYKVASYELLWDDLLTACAATAKPVILSTGMATMEEIQHAVKTLGAAKCVDLTLLHCISGYPAPADQCNLAAIHTMRKQFNCRVGWSDHSVSPAVLQRAIHRWGAETIEFHLDLDGKGEEYATGHCWLPQQIKQVIDDVQTAFLSDGAGKKLPTPAELKDREWRADPADGLRPLKHIRKSWNG